MYPSSRSFAFPSQSIGQTPGSAFVVTGIDDEEPGMVTVRVAGFLETPLLALVS